jgi:hypothetical protein
MCGPQEICERCVFLTVAPMRSMFAFVDSLQRQSLPLSPDRAVDLPRSQGAATTHSGAYVEESQRGERGKDQARRAQWK